MKTNLELVDAQQMAIDYPATFEVPDQNDLNEIKENDFVKVCVSDERFWCKVDSINGDAITATINNDLVFSDEHGLFCDDVIQFEKKNIYSILKETNL